MKQVAIDSGVKSNMVSKSLILSYFGQNMWITTPLIKWYIKQNLCIKVFEVITFKPEFCFKEFIDVVTEKRRLGDVNENSILIAEQMKLLSNSCYGKLIQNYEKQVKVTFGDNYKAQCSVNKPNFRRLEELDQNLYEINTIPDRIRVKLPLVMGLFVLQLAKLIILQFIYDFLKVYFRNECLQLLSHDTDSVYLAISANELKDVLVPDLRETYFRDIRHKWLPTECCSIHKLDYVTCRLKNNVWNKPPCCQKQYKGETRTPGLFKPEFIGARYIGLSPKCYFTSEGDKVKYSSKGVNKTNNLTFTDFEEIINRTKNEKNVCQ